MKRRAFPALATLEKSLGPRFSSPGCSVEPAVDLDMFFTFKSSKSSIHTIAWFLLIVVLCRTSRRPLRIRAWRR